MRRESCADRVPKVNGNGPLGTGDYNPAMLRTLPFLAFVLCALATMATAQVGILPGGCPSFPGFSGFGGGNPQVGNTNFAISPLPPCGSGLHIDIMGVMPATPTPLLPPITCDPGCQLVDGNPLVILINPGFLVPFPIPNNPGLVGAAFWFQHGCTQPNDPVNPGCVLMNGGLSITIMP